MDIETIIASFSYLGIFLLMTTNGLATFPSSQVLYIITGYFIFTDRLTLIPVIIAGAFGNTLGNILLYEITRRKGVGYITKYKIFPKKEVKKVTVALNKKGVLFLGIGKLLPAIKVFVPVAAGIARTRRDIFTILMFITSMIWTAPFIAIGYYFGKSSNIFGTYAVALIIIAFVVLGLFYRYINSEEVIREVEK